MDRSAYSIAMPIPNDFLFAIMISSWRTQKTSRSKEKFPFHLSHDFGTWNAYNHPTGIATDTDGHQESTCARKVLKTRQKSSHPASKERQARCIFLILGIEEFWIRCVVSKKLHWLMNLEGEVVSNVLDWSQSSRIMVLQYRFVYFNHSRPSPSRDALCVQIYTNRNDCKYSVQ